MKKIALFFVLFFLSSWVRSDILVFVHGFDSSANVWRNTGFFSYMRSQGWQDAGTLISHPRDGVVYLQAKQLKPYRMVTVDLPSAAPIQVQGQFLASYLKFLQQQSPQQSFSLIGHSVGGIVARYVLLQYPQFPIKRLISIASPHLGTGMAEAAELLAKTPLSLITPIVGGDIINDSEILMEQLQREEPGSFLFWLNRLKHPDINYISVVRSFGSLLDKDFYVPSYSQDLRYVRGIQQARSFPSGGKHKLQYRDAFLVARLVNQSVY
ncbi:MAG: alpha/beta fold hydrolase [Pseudomonadota bacterium]